MKTRTILISLAATLAGYALSFAGSDAFMGTWKLNDSKSKITPGMGKNVTVVYSMAGDSIKATVDGVDADGKPTHNEWTGKFDGKDYAVSGDPTSDMRACKQINDHTLELTVKKGGKVTVSGKIIVAADGKSRTVAVRGTDPKGKKYSNISFYDKQ
jgi:hypothetical protein